MEEWREIVGSKGQYFVSNQGRVKNKKGLIMKQRINNWGYPCVTLSGYIAKHDAKVHRLVADAFLGGGGRVYHLNRNKQDNRVENLVRQADE